MKYLSLSLVLILAACASTPETHYYVLSSSTVVAETASHESNGEKVVGVGRIALPDYLKQSGLVVQTDNHQIRAANYHLWGEPLEHGIRRSLLQQLSAEMPGFRIEGGRGNEHLFDYRLDVELESFLGTQHGSAVLSGRWALYSMKEHELLASDRFSFDGTLSQTGYPALVETQANLLAQLTREMSNRIAVAVLSETDATESQRLSASQTRP